MKKSNLILNAVLALLFLFILIVIHVPQSIYFSQREYFTDYFTDLISPILIYGLFAVVLASVILSVLPRKILKYVVSVLLVFAILLWVYVDFFVVSYGALDGSEIDFKHFNSRGNIEIIVCFVCLILALVFHKLILKQGPFLVGLLSLGLLVMTALNIYNEPADKQKKEDIDPEFFNYSSEKNIILIVLDTFGAEYFQQALAQDPSIKNKFKGFVSYSDAISNYPATKGSLPSLLTGKMIPGNIKYRKFLQEYVPEHGLPNFFSQKGYLVSVLSVYSWFKHFYKERYLFEPQLNSGVLQAYNSAQLLDYSLFRAVPHYLKQNVFDGGNWFFSKEISKQAEIPNSFPEKGNFFLELMRDNIKVADKTPRFKVIHVTTPHPEYRYNRSCELIEDIPAGKQAMLEQSMCALKKVGELLMAYKESGIYDNSLIVVTSDHGSRVLNDKTLTGFPSYFEMNTSGIMFMIKGVGQNNDFRQVDQPFSLVKLYDALVNAKLHQSEYDFLQDDERLFYAYRNHHQISNGFLADAPLFKVLPNHSLPQSWQLKEFAIHDCKPVKLPVIMTFKTREREGYCSIFGFAKPAADGKGSWTESVDARIILELSQESVNQENTYNLEINFSPFIVSAQKSIDLKVLINDHEIGTKLITEKGEQKISFEFSGELIDTKGPSIIKLLMPGLKSPKEMVINGNTRKLGLMVTSIEIRNKK